MSNGMNSDTQRRFRGKPIPAPAWEVWRHCSTVDLWEAVALSINIEPRTIKHPNSDSYDRRADRDVAGMADRLLVAGRSLFHGLSPRTIQPDRPDVCRVGLADFVTWALSLPWEMPGELKSMANVAEPLAGGKVTGQTPHSPPKGAPKSPADKRRQDMVKRQELARQLESDLEEMFSSGGCKESDPLAGIIGNNEKMAELMVDRDALLKLMGGKKLVDKYEGISGRNLWGGQGIGQTGRAEKTFMGVNANTLRRDIAEARKSAG